MTGLTLPWILSGHSFRVRQYGVWGQHGKSVRNYMQHKKSTNFFIHYHFSSLFFFQCATKKTSITKQQQQHKKTLGKTKENYEHQLHLLIIIFVWFCNSTNFTGQQEKLHFHY
jgi:hypothetical protein